MSWMYYLWYPRLMTPDVSDWIRVNGVAGVATRCSWLRRVAEYSPSERVAEGPCFFNGL